MRYYIVTFLLTETWHHPPLHSLASKTGPSSMDVHLLPPDENTESPIGRFGTGVGRKRPAASVSSMTTSESSRSLPRRNWSQHSESDGVFDEVEQGPGRIAVADAAATEDLLLSSQGKAAAAELARPQRAAAAAAVELIQQRLAQGWGCDNNAGRHGTNAAAAGSGQLTATVAAAAAAAKEGRRSSRKAWTMPQREHDQTGTGSVDGCNNGTVLNMTKGR